MEYRGRVQGGVVVLEAGAVLPEGAEVRVAPVANDAGPTLYERLRSVVGKADWLPEDMAENHDHYIRGGPKRADE